MLSVLQIWHSWRLGRPRAGLATLHGLLRLKLLLYRDDGLAHALLLMCLSRCCVRGVRVAFGTWGRRSLSSFPGARFVAEAHLSNALSCLKDQRAIGISSVLVHAGLMRVVVRLFGIVAVLLIHRIVCEGLLVLVHRVMVPRIWNASILHASHKVLIRPWDATHVVQVHLRRIRRTSRIKGGCGVAIGSHRVLHTRHTLCGRIMSSKLHEVDILKPFLNHGVAWDWLLHTFLIFLRIVIWLVILCLIFRAKIELRLRLRLLSSIGEIRRRSFYWCIQKFGYV
mmetsp:Transcript_7895/g.13582  ORF Transcript_7895/g.13582 Transcript_7895/m.13582 type:complete len:282 (-) Transcript_7895:138-983(-)